MRATPHSWSVDLLPTPVGHSLAGFAIHLAAGVQPGRRSWLAAAGLVALANLPDIDFLPGYLIGQPRSYHWGPTHSLAAAFLVGTCAGFMARAFARRFLPFFLLGGAAYASHLMLDMLLGPGAFSEGLQLFWPVSAERYTAPRGVFLMFPASLDQLGPVRALFSRGALPLMIRELAILGPVCLVAWLLGQSSNFASRAGLRHRTFTERRAADCEDA